ncbi:MAG: hypothetical protein Q7T50_02105 [Candidatus Magasanikbacteria bacterium]|nr:hypothetical protein [Candidatus Magasanikbacteria bacterium]
MFKLLKELEMRTITFRVKETKTNPFEVAFAALSLILCVYLLLGIPVWIQLFQGQNVISPGLLYEPVVEWLGSKT